MNQPFDPNQHKNNQQANNQAGNQFNNQPNNQPNNQFNSQANGDFDLQSEFGNQSSPHPNSQTGSQGNFQAGSQGDFQGNFQDNQPFTQQSTQPPPFNPQQQNQYQQQNQQQYQNHNQQQSYNQPQDPYAPPESQIAPPPMFADNQFYVVSKRKFTILTIATFGIYNLYWFWKHWELWKIRNHADIWPIPRAIFAIFFTHKLFSNINEEAERSSGNYLPSLATPATIFVISTIAYRIVEKLTETTPIIWDVFIVIGFLALDYWALWQGQEQANIACNDPDGASNDNLTGLNYVFIVLGVILWLLFFFGVWAEVTGFA